jgi:glycolate oxidase iron-sulfur subunit
MQTHFTEAQRRDPQMVVAEKAIRTCVHCGFCNATCPTYTLLGDELDGPRGRIMLMKDMLENQRVPSLETVKHIDRCLSCLSCKTTCPSGVDYMHLIDHARAYIEQRHRRPRTERMLREVLARVLPYRGRLRLALALGRLFSPLGRFLPHAGIARSLRAMLELSRVPRQRAVRAPSISRSPGKLRVAFLESCAEPVLRPNIQRAAARLFTRMGMDVLPAPGQGCCGALVHHLGREAQSLAFARANVDAWSRLIENGGLDAIVVTASGCGTSLKDYGFLLRDEPAYAARAARVSALACDVSEWLMKHGLPEVVNRPALSVAYHAACSLQHGQQLREPPRQLLVRAGFELREIAESHLCCGSAGVYNVLQPEIAEQLRARKQAAIAAVRPQVVASGNIGCLTQLARGSVIPVVHTVELLDWATGGPPPSGFPY